MVIKNYVDEKYPSKVEAYQKYLEKIKQTKIKKHSDITFVDEILMWQDNKDTLLKQFNILEFKIYCRNLTLANRKDWRVPTYDELLKLIDYKKHNSATKEKIEYSIPNKYWSGSKSLSQKDSYWYVDFKDGTTNFTDDSQRYNIRCVRDISKKAGEY
jgi:plasmid rolling circle replication initiator protein Rep